MSARITWQNLPLAHTGEAAGRSLVEASAGTGKTWTIGVLYLRLLLEQGLSPKQVIVSTFTNAAAAELSLRLRQRLHWALRLALGMAANQGDVGQPDTLWLQSRWPESEAGQTQRQHDQQRLQAALAELDAAPITTLHSLCSRILAEHPFAAGALFKGRKLVDAQPLQVAIGQDLRRLIDQGDGGTALEQVALAAGLGAESKKVLAYVPYLLQSHVRVAAAAPPPRVLAEAGVDAQGLAQDLASVLDEDRFFFKGRKQRDIWRGLAQAIAQGEAAASVFCLKAEVWERLAKAQNGLVKAGKENATMQGICAASEAIAEAVQQLIARQPLVVDLHTQPALRGFLRLAQNWCLQQLQARLDAAQQSTFDALIERVYDSLHQPGSALADALFQAWPVCLVDEFQDTDPLQFGILDAIYRQPQHGAEQGAAAGQERGRLVMIGDPKQAIYRFRGGDIAAYLQAVAHLKGGPAHLSLDTNYRSSKDFVDGMNAFYAATGTALAPPESASHAAIAYQMVRPKSEADASDLSDASGQPLRQALHLLVRPADAETEADEDTALARCAAAIARDLSPQGRRIQGQRLHPGQIAVLLPTHAQMQNMAAKLRRLNLPVVMGSRSSVFEGEAAQYLRLLLHAVLQPQDAGALRAALLTPLLGHSMAQVQAGQEDEAAWAAVVQGFYAWQRLLLELGPLAWLTQLMDEQAPRLLAHQEGERLLTDLRHLAELLQEAQTQEGGGQALARWLALQCEGLGESEDQASDSRSLRLESDGQRIKLMSLHASKGLEFDIVYLPLLWKHGAGKSRSMGLLADAEQVGPEKYLMLDKAAGLAAVAEQELAERYRILYVALTRAVHACHVFALAPETEKQPEAVPLNALLQKEGAWAALQAAPSLALHDDWPSAEPAPPYQPQAEVALHLQALSMPPRSTAPWRMTHSFSAISQQQAAQPKLAVQAEAEEGPASDETVAENTLLPQPEPQLEFSLECAEHPELLALYDIAGAHFGDAVHAILEEADRSRPLHEQTALITAQLKQHSVYRQRPDEDRSPLAQQLAQRLQTMLDTPLAAPNGPVLARIAPQDWLAEMEFNIHLDSLRLSAVQAACQAHGEPHLLPPQAHLHRELAGRLKGLIDLLFVHEGRVHVLDWKSNRLGPSLADYNGAALHTAMQAHHYRFQALLYTVALERYLRQRHGAAYVRAQHLGDCYYLFVRAVGVQDAAQPQLLPTQNGVWHHRFSDALLDAVQAAIGGPQHV